MSHLTDWNISIIFFFLYSVIIVHTYTPSKTCLPPVSDGKRAGVKTGH